MNIYDVKHYYMIFSILNATESHPISSHSLSKKLSLSNKTVQNNILNLSEYCLENGFEIVSKSGIGFYPLIIDSKKVSNLKQNLTIYFSKNHLVNNQYSLQFTTFVTYIINRSSPITINELCDKFYLSKSTVYTYISEITHVLNENGIQLINDRIKGIYTICDEFIKRYYIASSLGYNIFQYHIDELFEVNFQLLKENSKQTKDVIELLNKYDFVFNDEKFSIFLTYLSYSDYRYQRGYIVNDTAKNFDKNIFDLLEYKFAIELVDTLHLSYVTNKNELLAITSLVLIFNDQLEEICPKRYGIQHYSNIENLFHFLDNYLTSLSTDFLKIPNYQKGLMKLAYHLYFYHEFNLYRHTFSNLQINLSYTPNALARFLSRVICDKISLYFNERMSHRLANYVCSFFQNLLYSVQFEKSDTKILLVMNEGVSYNEYVIRWLNSHLHPKPLVIDQISLYQTSILDLNKYDLILTNYDKIDYIDVKYKVFKINDPIDQDCTFVNEYYRITNYRNISLEHFISYFNNIRFFNDCHITNTENFLTQLDNDLDGLGNIPIRYLRKLGRPINYYGGHKMLLVPYIYNKKDQHENILYIYFNEKKDHPKYNVLAFFSMYSDYSLKSLLGIMNFFNEIHVNPDIIPRIISYLSTNITSSTDKK